MTPGRWNLALGLILVSLWAAVVWVQPDRTKRNFRFIPQMEDPLTFESQRDVLPFGDPTGKNLVPPGSIPRGQTPHSGLALQNPFPQGSTETLKRGAFVFANYCALCHGSAGLGDGPVIKRGFPAPPSLLAGNSLNMSDGTMFRILSLGQGNMPGYAVQLTPEDRWKALSYVRQIQKQAKAESSLSAAKGKSP